jgi:translocation and assembly module TamB
MLADAPVRGSAKLAAGENGARVLDDLAFAVGKSQVGGSLTIGGDGLMNGNLSLVSPDLSKVAPLFLVDASGMMRAEIALDAEGGQQNAAFNGTATDVAYQNIALKSADIAGTARDLFKAPQIEGKFTLSDLRTGGLTIVNATGTAQRSGDSTAFKVDAALADGRANLDGTLAPADGGLAVGLKSFAFKRTGIDVALAAPTTIGVSGGAAHLDNLTIKAGAGSATLAGTVGSKIDAKATLNAIPAALVNAFAPDLGAEGTVSGVVEATGSASAPNASFDLTLAGTSVAASRNAGLGALGVTARGTLADRKVALRSEIFGADGMALTVGGTIGTAKDGPLALKITGSVPLSLGNRQLASRGAALQGALNVDVAVAGTTASPTYSGKISAANGGFVDPESGIVLKNMVLAASLAGNRLTLDRLEAASGDGNVAATGTIGLDPKAGLPVDLAFKIRRARYVDGTLIAARFDADLTMTGKLAEAPAIAGKVTLDRTEITVPEKLPGDAIAVDVKHVAPSPPVAKTLAIVKTPEKGARSAPSTGPSGIQLEVAVEAPQRIFIRGRGLDAEFGGRLTLHGSLSGLVASGGFDLVRGRLDILTKRITFDRGTITFAGDLDPIVDFSGTTKSGDTSITVSVTGRASDPQLNFSSSPELPQDEIMAQLIFDKSIGDLSPVQIARLAAAVSELSGGSGGLLGQLRATTGLDDLDVVTDSEGQTSVAAGRYISNNVYLGVEQGTAASSSRVTIDLDVTKDVKARAGVGADGDSSLGLFFEHEY